MTKDNWIKASEKLDYELGRLQAQAIMGEGRSRNGAINTIKRIKTLFKQVEKDAIERGYKQRDNEIIDEDNLAEAEEAHRTEEGYCCACGYDMAVMEGKIKDAIERGKKELIDKLPPEKDHVYRCWLENGSVMFADEGKFKITKEKYAKNKNN